MVRDWDGIPALSYQLSDDEVRAVYRQFAALRRGLGAICFANSALQIIFGCVRLWFHRTPFDVWFGVLQFAVAVLIAAAFIALQRSPPWRWPWGMQRAGELRFDDAGIVIRGARTQMIPWHSIRFVQAFDEVFFFSTGWFRMLIVPKRLFSDNGATLWALLENRLIGARSLVRRAGSRTIINTAASA